jgi:hypothetical protein
MIKRMATAVALSVLLASAVAAQAPAPIEGPARPPAASTESQSSQGGALATDATTTGSVPAPAAEAEAAPSTPEACIAVAAELGVAAEEKPLADDKLDQLDELFSKMETLCDAQQFAEAMGVAKDIRTMLDGQ